MKSSRIVRGREHSLNYEIYYFSIFAALINKRATSAITR